MIITRTPIITPVSSGVSGFVYVTHVDCLDFIYGNAHGSCETKPVGAPPPSPDPLADTFEFVFWTLGSALQSISNFFASVKGSGPVVVVTQRPYRLRVFVLNDSQHTMDARIDIEVNPLMSLYSSELTNIEPFESRSIDFTIQEQTQTTGHIMTFQRKSGATAWSDTGNKCPFKAVFYP